MVAVHQPDAGFVLSDRAISAYVTQAIEDGAEIHGHDPVVEWEPTDDGVIVRAASGAYRAHRLVISAGAWACRLAAPLRGITVAERQVLLWSQPLRPAWYLPAAFPVSVLEAPEGRFYGFPSYGIPGFKIGLYHHRSQVVDPDTWDPTRLEPEDEAVLRTGVARYFPAANGPTLSLKTCMFTNTPDEHFILDHYPGLPQVVLASPCSGHGFKFASALGEVLADLALDGRSDLDLEMFRLARFDPAGGQASAPAGDSA